MSKKSRHKAAREAKEASSHARSKHAPAVDPVLRRREIGVCLALAVICAVIYARVAGYPFINMDDRSYVYGNPYITSGLTSQSIAWAFQNVSFFYWQPLTWLSHMLDYELFGASSGWHHIVNVLLHAVNASLLFLVLRRMTGAFWRSAMAAALFAIHPLRVESVAWVAERKDVLCGLFWLLTMGTYWWYAQQTESWKRYGLVIGGFALALMSKPSAVTLPFALLLLDYWPLRRTGQTSVPALLREKLPLFAMSAVSSVLTYQGQEETGAIQAFGSMTAWGYIGNALFSYVMYIGKTFWPARLAVLYPYDQVVPAGEVAASALLLAAITAFVIWKARSYPYLPVGWFWFLGVLVPMIRGSGYMNRADRFTYLPQIGLLLIIVWGAAELLQRAKAAPHLAPALAGLTLLALAVPAWNQVGYWRDSGTLFRHSLSVCEHKVAHNNLGDVLMSEGKTDEAIAQFQASLRIDPNYPISYRGLAGALAAQKRFPEAIDALDRAVRAAPDYGDAWYDRGLILQQSGRVEEARLSFQEALRRKLSNRIAAFAHNNIGVILFRAGRPLDAAAEFQAALALLPELAEAQKNLAAAQAAARQR